MGKAIFTQWTFVFPSSVAMRIRRLKRSQSVSSSTLPSSKAEEQCTNSEKTYLDIASLFSLFESCFASIMPLLPLINVYAISRTFVRNNNVVALISFRPASIFSMASVAGNLTLSKGNSKIVSPFVTFCGISSGRNISTILKQISSV